MKVKAIYDHGRLEFTQPVHLKSGRVRLTVEVPDEVLVNPPGAFDLSEELRVQARTMLDRLAAIRSAPLPSATPELTEKQQELIEAYESRACLREEQDRPV